MSTPSPASSESDRDSPLLRIKRTGRRRVRDSDDSDDGGWSAADARVHVHPLRARLKAVQHSLSVISAYELQTAALAVSDPPLEREQVERAMQCMQHTSSSAAEALQAEPSQPHLQVTLHSITQLLQSCVDADAQSLENAEYSALLLLGLAFAKEWLHAHCWREAAKAKALAPIEEIEAVLLERHASIGRTDPAQLLILLGRFVTLKIDDDAWAIVCGHSRRIQQARMQMYRETTEAQQFESQSQDGDEYEEYSVARVDEY